jgi:hypothetical protein
VKQNFNKMPKQKKKPTMKYEHWPAGKPLPFDEKKLKELLQKPLFKTEVIDINKGKKRKDD